MHGIGFNVNSHLDYFDYIVPCGIEDKAVTSIQKELGRTIDFSDLKSRLKTNLSNIFDYDYQELAWKKVRKYY